MSSKALLSVVVPCFNEEEVIQETHSRLAAILATLDLDFEIIYVDDGCRDRTAELLRDIQAQDNRARVVRFSRNFGHQIAVTAGLEHAAGDAVVLIDADLQDPPEVIQDMVARWREGYDVAYGTRTDRAGETAFKLWTAKCFYRALNTLSDTEIPMDTGDFRLMDRTVVDSLLKMPERDRFLRGMVSWVGFKQVAVPYQRAPRFAGATKYSLIKMVRLATAGILSFSLAPLRLALGAGVIAASSALLGLMLALAICLFSSTGVSGAALLAWAIMFLGGVQLIALGVAGEYLGRIYREVQNRPLYLVQERLGFSQAQSHREAA